MSHRSAAALRSVAWLAFLGFSLTALHRLGAAMPVAPSDLTASVDDLALVIVGVARIIALAVGWYLLLATVLLLVVRLSGWWRAVAVVDVLVPRLVRRTVHGAIGLTLLTAPAPALAATASSTSPAPTVVVSGDATEPVTMRRLPDEGPVAPTPSAAPTTARTWTIAPGDHLWSIAERVLAEHLGRAPADDEVDPYWRRLVEVNRPRLVDPDLPDLVHPGQVLEVPPAGV